MTAGPETCVQSATALPEERESGFPGAFLLLAKPGIVLAETAAGFTGMLLASDAIPSSPAVAWCLLSLILAASGSAMINCVIEADSDRKMARLAGRSRAMAAAGRATVLTTALLILGGAFFLAGSFLNPLTLFLLTAAVGSYLFLYTLWLKPRSPWSVFAGAIPGALPPLIGAAAVTGSVSALPLLLGLVIFIWQLPHSWFLALHYGEEYRQADIPVLPATHGILLTKRLTQLSSISLLPVTLSFSLLGNRSPLFAITVLLAGAFFLFLCHRYLFRTFEYRKGFIASIAYLATVFAVIISEIIL